MHAHTHIRVHTHTSHSLILCTKLMFGNFNITHGQGTAVLRNGVKYKLKVQTEQGLQVEEFLHVLIVDSESQQVHYLALPHTTSHYLTLPRTTSHYLTLPHTTSQYLTLPHTTSHYLTLPHTTSHYLTLPHTTSHYLTLPHTTPTPPHRSCRFKGRTGTRACAEYC